MDSTLKRSDCTVRFCWQCGDGLSHDNNSGPMDRDPSEPPDTIPETPDWKQQPGSATQDGTPLVEWTGPRGARHFLKRDFWTRNQAANAASFGHHGRILMENQEFDGVEQINVGLLREFLKGVRTNDGPIHIWGEGHVFPFVKMSHTTHSRLWLLSVTIDLT